MTNGKPNGQKSMSLAELSVTIFAVIFFSNFSLPELTPPQDRYSMSIPDGWVEMTSDEINERSAVASELAGKTIEYSKGYRLKEYASTSTFPFVLIQDRETDIQNYSALEQSFKAEESKFNKALDDISTSNSDLIKTASTQSYLYNPERHFVQVGFNMDLVGEDPIKAQTLIFLGQKQSTQMNLYVYEREVGLFADDLQSFINSFQYKPGFEYNETGANSGKPDPYRYIYVFLKGAFIGLLVHVLFRWFGSRGKK